VAERLSLRRRLAYALGAPGFQITDRIVVAIAIFYYLPPGDSDLVPQVSEATFLGVLTTFGAARLLGGLVDSLADPLVGWASDRSRSRLGRRRVFLLAGVGPMVLAPVLLFFPPGAPGSGANFTYFQIGVVSSPERSCPRTGSTIGCPYSKGSKKYSPSGTGSLSCAGRICRPPASAPKMLL